MARKRSNGPSKPPPSGLVGPGGKVSKSAVFRAAQAQHAQPAREPVGVPAPGGDTIDDDAPITQRPVSPEEVAQGDEPPPQRVVFTLSRDLDKRLDKYLVDRITFMSRAQLQRLIADGAVLVNARPGKNSTKLRLGDVVEVYVPPPPTDHVAPEDIPLAIMHEDEHIVVVNKSPDIIVHPARSHNRGTMINALAYHFQHRTGGALSSVGKEFARPGVVHRLDRQTSGCIVFAKNDQAHWQLGLQFEHRTVDKRYLAFVHGLVEPRIQTIDVPLGPHPSREKGSREKQAVRHDHLGKPALTIVRVLGHYALEVDDQDLRAKYPAPGAPGATGVSLVEVELKTGRTHQIRVHMSHIAHPLLGDDMYTGKLLPQIQRVALHAALLSFKHPLTHQPMRFRAPLPADLCSLLTALRQNRPEEYPPPPGAVFGAGDL